MTDLNSLSKEELIKLVTQKEEQLRIAECKTEEAKLLAKQAQEKAERRERSNIRFAHGVTSLALLLKGVNGSYLAEVEEYLSYADDEEDKNYRSHFCANCKFLRPWKRSYESRRNL